MSFSGNFICPSNSIRVHKNYKKSLINGQTHLQLTKVFIRTSDKARLGISGFDISPFYSSCGS